MDRMIIGVDPHKASVTIEVVDRDGVLAATGRFPTARGGYQALMRFVRQWPQRTWAVEGTGGAGRPLALRLVRDGERVLDVPAKLAARVRVFDTGQDPGGLFAGYAARASWRRARWLVRRRSSGVPVQ